MPCCHWLNSFTVQVPNKGSKTPNYVNRYALTTLNSNLAVTPSSSNVKIEPKQIIRHFKSHSVLIKHLNKVLFVYEKAHRGFCASTYWKIPSWAPSTHIQTWENGSFLDWVLTLYFVSNGECGCARKTWPRRGDVLRAKLTFAIMNVAEHGFWDMLNLAGAPMLINY